MRRLNTTAPTVRSLAERGVLKGRKERRGASFVWRIDQGSIDRFLKEHGPFTGRRRPQTSRLDELERAVASLRQAVTAAGIALPASVDAAERERDDLRARVVVLEDALARTHAAAELQRQADVERAGVIENLTAALSASERADALRREALHELEEAIAGASRPGHAGELH
jgi:hypothetical protein